MKMGQIVQMLVGLINQPHWIYWTHSALAEVATIYLRGCHPCYQEAVNENYWTREPKEGSLGWASDGPDINKLICSQFELGSSQLFETHAEIRWSDVLAQTFPVSYGWQPQEILRQGMGGIIVMTAWYYFWAEPRTDMTLLCAKTIVLQENPRALWCHFWVQPRNDIMLSHYLRFGGIFPHWPSK